MTMRDFKMLFQKLALQMWNRCVTVFNTQRKQAILKMSQAFKMANENEDLAKLNMLELEAI